MSIIQPPSTGYPDYQNGSPAFVLLVPYLAIPNDGSSPSTGVIDVGRFTTLTLVAEAIGADSVTEIRWYSDPAGTSFLSKVSVVNGAGTDVGKAIYRFPLRSPYVEIVANLAGDIVDGWISVGASTAVLRPGTVPEIWKLMDISGTIDSGDTNGFTPVSLGSGLLPVAYSFSESDIVAQVLGEDAASGIDPMLPRTLATTTGTYDIWPFPIGGWTIALTNNGGSDCDYSFAVYAPNLEPGT